MNERTEAHLRNALSAVDDATLPSLDAVGARVLGVQRRRARRHRAVGGLGAVGVVALAAAMVWNTSSSPAQMTTGDGGPTTTAASAPTSTLRSAVTTPAPTAGWSEIPVGPQQSVSGASVVWTGSEAVMVGGAFQDATPNAIVTAYDPLSMTWRVVSSDPVPVLDPIVHWTGDQVLAVGVLEDGATTVAATLDIDTGEWAMGASMPFGFDGGAPTPNVWTGTSLLLFSGDTPVVYDPTLDEWRYIAPSPLTPRRDASSVWTGSEWVVWGGLSFTTDLAAGDGAAYDPATDTWRTIADSPLTARLVDGVWSGSELIVLAGRSGNLNGMMAYADGAAYDPVADAWRSLADGPAHPGADLAMTDGNVLFLAKGAYSVYNIELDEWTRAVDGVGVCFDGGSPVSTGTQVLLLGCWDGSTGGAVFTPG